MAEPLVKFQKVEKQLQGYLASLKKLVESQYILTSEIRTIQVKFQQQRPLLKKDVPAVEKSIFRRTIKLLRKAGIVQRHLTSTTSKLLEQIKSLEIIWPSTVADKLASQEFPLKIETYAHLLLRYFSRKDGLLLKNARKSSVEGVFFSVEEVLEKGIRPIIGLLESIHNFLKKNKTALEVAIVAEDSIHLNLEKVTASFRGVGEPIYLLDADFATAIEKERLSKGKTYFNLTLGRAKLKIPKKVWDEMTYCPPWSAAALVPKQLAHYLQNLPHTEIIYVDPTSEEKNSLTNFWKTTTKGKRASDDDVKKFKESGDMELLVYTQRNAVKEPIVILSNDNDIIKVVPSLDGRIEIYSYVRGSLVRAH